MADSNITVNGNPVATDLISGVHIQAIKTVFGVEGVKKYVDDAQPLPIKIIGAIPAGANSIGTVSAAITSLPGSLAGIESEVTYADTLKGLPLLGVRQDTAAPLAADGKTHMLSVDSLGRLREATLASRRATDGVGVFHGTDKLMSDLTELTPKFAKINAAANTADQSIVAAVSAKKIRVISLRVMAGATATAVTFRSKPAGAGADISETFNCDVRSGLMLGFNPVGHFETNADGALAVSTGTGGTVGIGVVYVEV